MGMKNKWDQRVYIDLYAGAGLSRTPAGKILKSSALLALNVAAPFDKYIFCERDSQLLASLEQRVKTIAPDANATFIVGDCDAHVDAICTAIPKFSLNNKVLTLCVVDPFDFGLKFATIKRLAGFYMDFVVLLAVGMDANRNYDHYVDGQSTKLDEALGNTEWRQRWKDVGVRRRDFRSFLAGEFSRSMESLGYLPQTLDQMKLVKSYEKNLPLYYLALFSKSQTAYQFWKQVLKYGTDQPSLFEV